MYRNPRTQKFSDVTGFLKYGLKLEPKWSKSALKLVHIHTILKISNRNFPMVI
jgi:hypothetical protein